MGDIQSAKATLWLEGLRGFRRHGHEWLTWAVGFFLVVAVCNFFMLDRLQDVLPALKNLPPDPQKGAALLAPLIAPALIWIALIEVAVLVQYYVYIVFFSVRELKLGQPVLGVGRFFYALGKMLQATLIFLAVSVVFGIVFGLLKFGLGANTTAAKTASGVVQLFMQIVVYYLAIKYSFVYVLAVNKMRPVLTTSWNLTETNWWRLFGNGLVILFWVVLFLFAVLAVAGVVAWSLRTVLHIPAAGPAGNVCIAVMGALAITVITGVFTAYRCTSCRILINEKRRSDPNFAKTIDA